MEGIDDFEVDGSNPFYIGLWFTLLAMGCMSHIYIMAGPLVGWAEGNFVLLFSTFSLAAQSTFASFLMLEYDGYLFLPYWMRIVVQVLAYTAVVYWFGGLISEMVLLLGGEEPFDTAS